MKTDKDRLLLRVLELRFNERKNTCELAESNATTDNGQLIARVQRQTFEQAFELVREEIAKMGSRR